MNPTQGLVLGEPVTIRGKTIVPVFHRICFMGERCGMCSAVPVAVLVTEGGSCFFAPLSDQFGEGDLREAFLSGIGNRIPE